MSFRGLLLWIHLILGLTGAVFIAIASVTGAWIVVQVPLERLLIPLPRVATRAVNPDWPRILTDVEARYAPRRVTRVVTAEGKGAVLELGDRSRVFVDPSNGTILRFRQLRLISFENFSAFMRRMHTSLLLGQTGRLIVTLATFEAFLLILSGLWLWWRRKHWRFTPWKGSIYRVSWDLHNASGVWFMAPALVMTVTGLLIHFPGPVSRMAGVTPTPNAGAPSVAVAAEAQLVVPLSRLLAVADSVAPNEPVVTLSLPHDGSNVAAVEKASGTIYLNHFSGDFVEFRPPAVPNAADRANAMVEQLHTGEQFGGAGMTVMALGSVVLALMTVTGVILGWKRILILTRKGADD